MGKIEFNFENLKVWQAARILVKEVYLLLEKFPAYERFALADQIRRSVISVASNIAEGKGRETEKETIHFLSISYGSLMECYCQLTLAMDLNYLSASDLENIKPRFEEIAKMLSGYKAYLRRGFQPTTSS